MRNQKVIALGLALGLITSAITPVIAATVGQADDNANMSVSQITPYDMEKLKDVNKGLGGKFEAKIKDADPKIKNKPLAECSKEDYEEMYNGGMKYDEIVEVLEIAYEQGEKIKDIISEVKKSDTDKVVNGVNIKKELTKRLKNKPTLKVSNESGKKLKEYILKLQKEGKLLKKVTITNEESESPQVGPSAPQMP